MRRRKDALIYRPLYQLKPKREETRGWRAAVVAWLTFGLLGKNTGKEEKLVRTEQAHGRR